MDGGVKNARATRLPSRRDRLARGELVDVSPYARTAGFRVPVALTRDAWAVGVGIAGDWSPMECGSQAVRLRAIEMLSHALQAVRRASDSDTVHFKLYRPTGNCEGKAIGRLAIRDHFLVRCEPGDIGEPVVTISLAVSLEPETATDPKPLQP